MLFLAGFWIGLQHIIGHSDNKHMVWPLSAMSISIIGMLLIKHFDK